MAIGTHVELDQIRPIKLRQWDKGLYCNAAVARTISPIDAQHQFLNFLSAIAFKFAAGHLLDDFVSYVTEIIQRLSLELVIFGSCSNINLKLYSAGISQGFFREFRSTLFMQIWIPLPLFLAKNDMIYACLPFSMHFLYWALSLILQSIKEQRFCQDFAQVYRKE